MQICTLSLQGVLYFFIHYGSLLGRTDVEAETLICWPPDAKN